MKGKRKMRDNQKSKVYRAERLALEVFDEKPLTLDEAEKIKMKVIKSYKLNRDIIIQFKRCYSRIAYAKNLGWSFKIVLPPWSQNKLYFCHELAHVVIGFNHGHDGKFVSVFLKLVKRFIGKTEADILKLAFKQMKVKTR